MPNQLVCFFVSYSDKLFAIFHMSEIWNNPTQGKVCKMGCCEYEWDLCGSHICDQRFISICSPEDDDTGD